MAEFLKVLFEPPVLILFVLAVAGLADMLGSRSDYRFNVGMEWRVREQWMRGWMKNPNEEMIERARQRFYKRKYLKAPKREGER